jgi:HemY protein
VVRLYGECLGKDVLKQIERAENWLKLHPEDAALLQTLGKLCMKQELWGKAQSYLEASLSIEPSVEAHLALAQLLEKIGRAEEAGKHYRESMVMLHQRN